MLVVEDEPLLAEAIRDGLRLEAIAADIAGDGESALEQLSINTYDVAVNAAHYTHFSDAFDGEAGPLTLDFYPLDYNADRARRQSGFRIGGLLDVGEQCPVGQHRRAGRTRGA